MEDRKFVLELNESQLRLVKDALEEYFRIRMNQWGDLANDLAGENLLEQPKDDSDFDKDFDAYIIRRDCVRNALEAAGRMIWKDGDIIKTKGQRIAEDIFRVIRYELWHDSHKSGENIWCVDADKPINVSGEPLPKCRRVDE